LERKKKTDGTTKEDVYHTISKKDLTGFEVFLVYSGPIKAPVSKGDEIALIKIYNKKNLVKSIPIYAAEKVKKVNFLLSIFTSFNYMIWGDA
jgi:D-alanyl-D-alanine carboxypeptidase (penicillin-binding protein 5/6)